MTDLAARASPSQGRSLLEQASVILALERLIKYLTPPTTAQIIAPIPLGIAAQSKVMTSWSSS